MTIRPARTGDGPETHALFERSVRTLGSCAYEPDEIRAWLSGLNPERLEARLLSMVSFVAEAEGHVVGFASLDVRHSELDFLYVDPDWVRRGFGRRLSDEVESAARSHGIWRLFIVASLNAVLTYERLGYEWEEDLVKVIDGIPVPCRRMSKGLGPN